MAPSEQDRATAWVTPALVMANTNAVSRQPNKTISTTYNFSPAVSPSRWYQCVILCSPMNSVWIVFSTLFKAFILPLRAHLGWQFCQRRWGCGWLDSSSGGYETAICIPWWLYAGPLQWRARCQGFAGSVFSDDDLTTPSWGPAPTAHS